MQGSASFLLLANSFRRNSHVRDRINPGRTFRRRPSNRISNDRLHFRLKIGWIRFVAGPEVEYFPIPAFPAAARPENLASLKPGNENSFVRARNSERFAIHFFGRDLEIGVNFLSDRVAGWHTQTLSFSPA